MMFSLTYSAAQSFVITEFCASNQSGLTDEDGDTSDWVEIQNVGGVSASLAGWRLTDDAGEPAKWIFPAVTLDPKGCLVVFASQKNRFNPQNPLHTNFKLSSAGGYLGLFKADGSVATVFNPYPAQYPDRSYGYQQSVATTTLIGSGAALKWSVPTGAVPSDATWSARTFSDGTWTTGANGVGFQMLTNGWALKTYFSNQAISSLDQAEAVIKSPTLQTSVHTENIAVINFDDSSSSGNYPTETMPLALSGGNHDYFVVEGTGTLTITQAMAGIWTFCISSDDGCSLQIRPKGGTYTTVLSCPYLRGMGSTVGTYTFSAGDYEIRALVFENGGGAGGEVSAKRGSYGSWDNAFKLIGDTANGGLAVKSVLIGASDYTAHVGVGSNTQAAMYDAATQRSSCYIRIPFTNPGGLTSLTMPIRYDDGFVAYLNGSEVARRNAPAGGVTDTSTATGDRISQQALAPENIDLTPYLGLLIAGAGNVLAIHGLNESGSSADFLIKAELIQAVVSTGSAAAYFTSGTPGGFNTTAIYNKVSPVTITGAARGMYNSPQTVFLTTWTTGATIRYTLDGSSPCQLDSTGAIMRDAGNNAIPSPTSGVYASPLTISKTTVLRYAAFKSGSDPSDSVTQTYIFTADVKIQSPNGEPPAVTNPPGASPAITTWPSSVASGQYLNYGMDPDIVGVAPYKATIESDLKAIPSFSIVTDVKVLFDDTSGIYVNPGGDGIEWERPASLELIHPDGTTGFQANCGVRVRGGFSRSTGNPKHAFRIFFRDQYGPGKLKYPFFGNDSSAATEFSKFDIRCAQNYSWSFQGDSGNGLYFRDEFNRQTQLDMGQLSSHTAFYHLYVNGQYWGLFNIDERPEANFAASYLGGSADDYDTIKVAPDNGYTIYATDGNMDAWTSLWQQADTGLAAGNPETVNNANYQKLVGNDPDGTPNQGFPMLLDPANVIDYCIMVYWGGNLDAAISAFLGNNAPNNCFGFRDRTGAHGGFRFVLHDSEHTLLNVYEDRTGPWPAGSSAAQGASSALAYSNPQYIFQQCLYAQEFKMLFADRVFRHFNYDGALTPAAAMARFDVLKAQIDRAIVGESARWGDAQTEPPINRDTNWITCVNNTRSSFLPSRTSIVLQQFRGKGWYPDIDPPQWSVRGGTLATGATTELSLVSGQSGTIYYTTDGTDPRQYDPASGLAGVRPGALVYSGPITIDSSKVIRTRVKNGNTWSAIDEAAFYTTQDFTGLAVTEINYNPLPNGSITSDEFEFLELKNTTANAMDLGGLSFTAGITYTFPTGTILSPGAFYVLARNATQFHNRYPAQTVNGVYTGKLDNGGETLTISDPGGGVVLSVDYSDSPPWPAAADGSGFSLVTNNTAYNPDDGHNWRASANAGGSPGTDDPPVNIPAIVINEVLTNSGSGLTDMIELRNLTGSSVNIGDWWLSDDRNTPQKYRIPTGTMIPAGGYASFTEAQFNPVPGVAPGFALGSAGDDVYLFSGNSSGVLTGYSHGFEFAGAQQNVSFGRYVNSVGEEQFTRQTFRTFGSTNTGPRVGPLVINEVMYSPYPNYDKYVEIKNISAATVNLFDPANPANRWKLSGLGYTFPAGQTIPAGALALVVPIDPATFRTKYAVPAAVQILGPYTGTLQTNGERLSLEMPDTPVVQGGVTVVPYVVIDSVRYNDKLPWPVAAAGGGPSLQRLDSGAYADDPANWFASGATPGAANAANQAPVVALTNPASGATFTLPATVNFVATAVDTDGSVMKVEFFVDGGKVGEATSAPYTYAWAATGGAHSCTAVAIDNSLGVTVSAPRSLYATTPASKGLKAQYFVGAENFSTGPAGIRIDPVVNFSVGNNWPANTGFPSITNENYSVRWTGQVMAPASGSYTFYINSDDGSFLYLNDVLVIGNGGYHGDVELSYTTSLVGGRLYKIQMDMFQGGGGATAQLSWSGPDLTKQIIPQSALYPDSSPILILQPVAVACDLQTRASFLIAASGVNNSYQWLKDGVPIPGATSTAHSLPRVQASDAGQYSCLVSNSSGFAASNTVALTVTSNDSDNDGIPNSWESLYGYNSTNAGDANLDSDGDGMTNLQEFLAGTDPRNAGSRFESTATNNSSNQMVVRFTAQPYVAYTVQYKDSFGSTAWLKLCDIPAAATLRTLDVTDTTGTAGAMRFYRVATPQQP